MTALGLWLLLSVVLGMIPAAIAGQKGRNPGAWWLFGFALFPIAMIAVLLVKPTPEAAEERALANGSKRCPACAEVVKRQALVCRYCGHTFGERDAQVALR